MLPGQALYELHDTVIRGKHIGRKMGVPTANLAYPKDVARPQDGIYVAELVLPGTPTRHVQGVLSQGRHPTLPEGAPTVEVHLFDFDEDIYGRQVQVRYLHYLRAEQRFESPVLMRAQIARDIAQARAWFARQNASPVNPCPKGENDE